MSFEVGIGSLDTEILMKIGILCNTFYIFCLRKSYVLKHPVIATQPF